ncbi:MAG: DUF523 domain-containing protein [Oscillospiraceae bacterium]|nr:DUF523 domain-containing protein [Oscillospiraceae bacterium]
MRLLISACLLGEPCRYDGAAKPLSDAQMETLLRDHTLIPVCPEQLGGLPTPRTPSERSGDRVVMRDGRDVTAEFARGAAVVRALALETGAEAALLKARSPSCGSGEIYDGTFTGARTSGDGVTTEALRALGIPVYSEENFPFAAE